MIADADKISRLLKTARGQIDGILKMIEDDRYCIDISNQLLATASILKKANTEVLRAHLHHCVKGSFESDNENDKETKINELIQILEKTSK
jgi:DNA-binding FrmR family transcriptional regulator